MKNLLFELTTEQLKEAAEDIQKKVYREMAKEFVSRETKGAGEYTGGSLDGFVRYNYQHKPDSKTLELSHKNEDIAVLCDCLIDIILEKFDQLHIDYVLGGPSFDEPTAEPKTKTLEPQVEKKSENKVEIRYELDKKIIKKCKDTFGNGRTHKGWEVDVAEKAVVCTNSGCKKGMKGQDIRKPFENYLRRIMPKNEVEKLDRILK